MTTKRKFLLSTVALLLLSGCVDRPAVSPSCTMAKAPPDMMQPRQTPDMLANMTDALNGAQGIESYWLLDFAAEAQRYGLRLDACQAFIAALPQK